jgi:hypothetical protein
MEKDYERDMQGCVYGPPPIDRHSYQEPEPAVYGPPPIELESYQRPQPTVYGPPPTQKQRSCLFVVLILVIISGIILAWLLLFD